MHRGIASRCTAYQPISISIDSNHRLILTYLIPCHLLTTHTLPTTNLLASYPRLEALFRPLCSCIKRGDLSGFDAALSSAEHEFVKRRIYLTLERGRDIALRNLFRLVFLAGGFEEAKVGQAPLRRTRIPVAEFAAAIRVGSKIDGASRVDVDEVECFLANLIYKVSFEVVFPPKIPGSSSFHLAVPHSSANLYM
jgi:COP9 signalosome complex subunit 12